MGRKRKNDKHLPARVYLDHGAYFFVPKEGKKQMLSRDLGEALAKYGSLISARWSLRTLGDVIAKYRVEVLPLKRSEQTKAEEAKSLDRLNIAFGHFYPDNLTAQHCYAYMDARKSKDGKPVPTAARHEIVLLGHVYKKAIRWGAATANPASRLELPKRKGKRRKVPMEWVDQVRTIANPRMRLAIDYAVMVGQRRADTLKLKWTDVRPDGIYVKQGKTAAELLIEHSTDLEALLERSRAMKPHIPNEYLIRRANGKPFTARGFSSNWQRLMAKHVKAGGERFTFHDLRSVSADGADTVEEAQARLGHASVETTKRFYWKNVTKAKPRS
jgi:integrase